MPTSPTDGDRYLPSAAYNTKRHEYLIAWHNKWPGNRDIYGRRVNVEGAPIGNWFAISAGANDRIQPAVVYNATNDEYLVVYMYDASGSGSRYEIWGQRVAWNGAMTGSAFQIITYPTSSMWSPRLAWNSARNEYMVVWATLNTSTGLASDIGMRILLGDGKPDYATILDGTGLPTNPDVDFDPVNNRYLVVWNRVNASGKNVVEGDLHNSDGNRIGSIFGIAGDNSHDSLYPRASFSMLFHLVVYEYANSASDHDILGAYVGKDGGSAIPLNLVTGTTDDTKPAVVGASSLERIEYMITFQRANAAGAQAWLFPMSNYLPAAALPFCQYFSYDCGTPVVAGAPAGYLLAYTGKDTGTPGQYQYIYARSISQFAAFLPLTSKP